MACRLSVSVQAAIVCACFVRLPRPTMQTGRTIPDPASTTGKEASMQPSRDELFHHAANALGHDFSGEMRSGGRYAPAVQHGAEIHVSGQIPRLGDVVAVTGCVGADVSLNAARHAARICAMR